VEKGFGEFETELASFQAKLDQVYANNSLTEAAIAKEITHAPNLQLGFTPFSLKAHFIPDTEDFLTNETFKQQGDLAYLENEAKVLSCTSRNAFVNKQSAEGQKLFDDWLSKKSV
jgi:hypothetical protein